MVKKENMNKIKLDKKTIKNFRKYFEYALEDFDFSEVFRIIQFLKQNNSHYEWVTSIATLKNECNFLFDEAIKYLKKDFDKRENLCFISGGLWIIFDIKENIVTIGYVPVSACGYQYS